MKFLALIFAAAVAAVSATDCDLVSLAAVAGSADATQCGKDADGYSVVSAKYPTDAQLPKMCASTACNNLLVALKKAAPNECDVTLTNPPTALYAKLLTPIENYCNAWKATSTPPPASATPSVTSTPGSTTKAPTTTTAPASTTATPAAC